MGHYFLGKEKAGRMMDAMKEYDLSQDPNAPVMVTRYRVFNVERFARERAERLAWAAVLSGIFVLVLVIACVSAGVL